MLFLFLFGFCFSFVVNVDGVHFDKQDFYTKYTRADWDNASDGQKESILKDYVKRISCAIDAKNNGFDKDPFVLEKLNVVKKQLLVNFAYEELVAKPLIGKEILDLGYSNLKDEIFVKHILISFYSSSLSSPPDRSKEEAFALASSLIDSLDSDLNNFSVLAKNISDDPSVQKNGGLLGWLQWGQAPLSFQKPAWELLPGNVSEPVLTDYGYHIIVVEKRRPSEFSVFDSSSYKKAVLTSSLPGTNKALRLEAKKYDDSEVLRSGLVFHKKNIDFLLTLYNSFQKEKISSGKKYFDFEAFSKSVSSRLLICSFLDEHYGLNWFVQKTKNISPSKFPNFQNYEDFVDFFQPIVLRELAMRKAFDLEIDQELFFSKRLEIERDKILYDSFLRFLVNSVSVDSSEVKQYFLMNRDQKYIDPEKVVVRQIKLENLSLADSLFSVVEKNPSSFEHLAGEYSINRKNVNGLMEPFAYGKYNELGEVAFKLKLGEIAGPIKNLDKTFSIIRLENKIEKKYLKLKQVYTRIESLLLKEAQEKIKKESFDKYINNKGVVFSEEFKPFFN